MRGASGIGAIHDAGAGGCSSQSNPPALIELTRAQREVDMAASRNTIKAKIKPSGNVELKLERRDSWNRVYERITFSVSRRTLERALANATLEAPWKELLDLRNGVRR